MSRTTRLTAALTLAGVITVACSPSSTPTITGNSSSVSPAPAGAAAPPAAATDRPTAATTPGTSSATAAAPPAESTAAAPVSSPAAAAPSMPPPAAAPSTPPPPTPTPPTAREITIPANTRLSVTLTTPITSDASRVEDVVLASLAEPLVLSGTTVLPAGTELRGTVLQATRSGRVKGKAAVGFRFDRLTVRGEVLQIRTARITRDAASSRSSDVKKGAIGAGIGAVVGGIAGGGTGAAIGAAAGGTGTVLATRGNEVRLPAGTTVTTTLQSPLTILVPIDR